MKYAQKYAELEAHKVAEGLERRLVYTDNLMMVQIEFTDGPTAAPDPFHSHPHEQVAYVAEGEIILFVDNEPGVHLKPGDHYAIPSGIPHTIQRLSPYIKIIDCFTPIREDFLKK
jgi:quercetin dioxygenase-like cupin family protein